MSSVLTLPNILWTIKDISVSEQISTPTQNILGMKWRMKLVRFYDKSDGYSFDMILERISPTITQCEALAISVNTYFVVGSVTSLQKTAKISLLQTYWKIWQCRIADIRRYYPNFSLKSSATFSIQFNLDFGAINVDPVFSGKLLELTRDIDRASKVTTCADVLSSDLEKLLTVDEQMSDVVLICGDNMFRAHKAILSARSEVFAAMFRTAMTESMEGIVHITDIEPQVMELFLFYVYTGKMSTVMTIETARKLLAAADKYCVEQLRLKCVLYVAENGGKNSKDKAVMPSGFNSNEDLKERLLKDLFKTAEWKRLTTSYLEEAYEICEPLMR